MIDPPIPIKSSQQHYFLKKPIDSMGSQGIPTFAPLFPNSNRWCTWTLRWRSPRVLSPKQMMSVFQRFGGLFLWTFGDLPIRSAESTVRPSKNHVAQHKYGLDCLFLPFCSSSAGSWAHDGQTLQVQINCIVQSYQRHCSRYAFSIPHNGRQFIHSTTSKRDTCPNLWLLAVRIP